MIQHLEISLYSDMAYTEYFPYPTYWQLDRMDQIRYDQTGIIAPLDTDLFSSRYESESHRYYHPGSGIQELSKDRIRFDRILDADAYFLDWLCGDKIYKLVSMDYGVVTIEHFVENYLLTVEPEYREKILRQFAKHNLTVTIDGDRQFINVWKAKKTM